MPSTARSKWQSAKTRLASFPPSSRTSGNEVLCGAFCDLLTVTAAAGEEDEVRASIDEGSGLFGTVMQHLHQIGWKIRLCAETRDQSLLFWECARNT